LTKANLLELHIAAYRVRRALIATGAPESTFEEYNRLEVTPLHIYLGRAEHANAVRVLAREMNAYLDGRPARANSNTSQVAALGFWEDEP